MSDFVTKFHAKITESKNISNLLLVKKLGDEIKSNWMDNLDIVFFFGNLINCLPYDFDGLLQCISQFKIWNNETIMLMGIFADL